MSSFGDRIKKLRKTAKIRQKDLAGAIGVTTRTVQYYESGERKPDQKQLVAIAQYFHTTTDYLLGMTADPEINILEESKKRDLLKEIGSKEIEVVKIPVYKLDSPGENIIVRENIVNWQYVPAQLVDHIGFLVADNSMNGSGIKKGSIILVKPQNTVESSRVVVVKIHDSIMIRRINYVTGGVILSPDNSEYQPEFIADKELDIIGLVVKVIIDVV